MVFVKKESSLSKRQRSRHWSHLIDFRQFGPLVYAAVLIICLSAIPGTGDRVLAETQGNTTNKRVYEADECAAAPGAANAAVAATANAAYAGPYVIIHIRLSAKKKTSWKIYAI